MAMTFDPATEQVRVYCDGTATASQITDPVAQDVFRYDGEPSPAIRRIISLASFSPDVVLKFNGYNVQTSGVQSTGSSSTPRRGRSAMTEAARLPKSSRRTA